MLKLLKLTRYSPYSPFKELWVIANLPELHDQIHQVLHLGLVLHQLK